MIYNSVVSSLCTDTSLSWRLCVRREVQGQHDSAQQDVHACKHNQPQITTLSFLIIKVL